MIARRDLAALPAGSINGAYLYAVEFSEGTVKVGVTRCPRLRAEQLHDFAARHGIRMVGVYGQSIGGRVHKHAAERAALAKMGHPVHGREWFAGCGIAKAIAAIKASGKRKPAKVAA